MLIKKENRLCHVCEKEIDKTNKKEGKKFINFKFIVIDALYLKAGWNIPPKYSNRYQKQDEAFQARNMNCSFYISIHFTYNKISQIYLILLVKHTLWRLSIVFFYISIPSMDCLKEIAWSSISLFESENFCAKSVPLRFQKAKILCLMAKAQAKTQSVYVKLSNY